MRQHWHGGRGLNVLDPLLRKPVQSLDEEQGGDHGEERDGEILAEDGNREEDLHNLTPRLLVEPLDLGLAERSQEDALHELPRDAHGDEARVEEQHEAYLGRGEVDHRRVELLPAAERIVHRRYGRQQAEHGVRLQPDHLGRRPQRIPSRIPPETLRGPPRDHRYEDPGEIEDTAAAEVANAKRREFKDGAGVKSRPGMRRRPIRISYPCD